MKSAAIIVIMTVFITSLFICNVKAKENEHLHHAKQAREHKNNYHGNDSIKDLPEDVRLLLQQEMREIQKAMKNIFDAYAVGDYKTIADLAGKIKESFILDSAVFHC